MKYIILFRAINVGGKNIVKMNDLKQLLSELGMKNITTYLQSGNALVESELDEIALKSTIELGFYKKFGFESLIIVRNINQVKNIIERLPFKEDELIKAEAYDSKVKHLYVYFLNEKPNSKIVDLLNNENTNFDKIIVGQREIYLLCYDSIRKSKLAIKTSKQFKISTVRNWNSINKIYNLMCSDN